MEDHDIRKERCSEKHDTNITTIYIYRNMASSLFQPIC